MSNGKQYLWQVHKLSPGFNQSLITLQKATCFYWPYKYKLNDFPQKMKDALGFKILKPEELEKLVNKRKE
jgi:hypothetical protein